MNDCRDKVYIIGSKQFLSEIAGVLPSARGSKSGYRPRTLAGIARNRPVDGETIMHCPVCHDTGKVTPEEAECWHASVRQARDG